MPLPFLQQLQIENWQVIERATINLGRFNVITGKSNAGKSAVIRALHALIKLPKGGGFVRDQASHCTVSLIDPLHAFQFYRTSSGTTLNLNDVPYSKLAGAIPEDFVKALGINALTLADGTQVYPSIQLQFDPQFLLSSSPRQVAEIVSQLAGLNALNNAVRAINKDTTKNSVRIRTLDDEMQTLRKTINTTNPTQLETALHGLERANERYQELGNRISTIVNLIKQRKQLQDTLNTLNKALQSPLQELYDRYIHLKKTHALASDLARFQGLLHTYKHLEDVPLQSLADRYQHLKQVHTLMKNLVDTMSQRDVQIIAEQKATQTLQSLQQTYHQHHLGEPCALCGQTVKVAIHG